jgi:hypothetical protein
MLRVGRQAQLVNPFPRSNADVGWIDSGTHVSQLLASLLGALKLFMCEALCGTRDEVTCAR